MLNVSHTFIVSSKRIDQILSIISYCYRFGKRRFLVVRQFSILLILKTWIDLCFGMCSRLQSFSILFLRYFPIFRRKMAAYFPRRADAAPDPSSRSHRHTDNSSNDETQSTSFSINFPSSPPTLPLSFLLAAAHANGKGGKKTKGRGCRNEVRASDAIRGGRQRSLCIPWTSVISRDSLLQI